MKTTPLQPDTLLEGPRRTPNESVPARTPRERVGFPDQAAPSLPDVGVVVDQAYLVEGSLGRGGMGEVLLARDLVLDRPVALKMVRSALVIDDVHRAQLLREARLLAGVTHPNVVRIYAFGSHSGIPYFAMEYVEGETLRRALRDGPLEPARAVQVLDAVCHGAAAMHDAGVVHGDIKPGNVILGNDGRICLMDFGVALRRNDATPNQAFGTAEYVAPELIRGSSEPKRRHALDVYSLGIMAFEVLTGHMPYRGDRAALFAMHLYHEVPPVSASAPELSAFDDPISRALSKDPAERQATPRELAEHLRAALPASDGKQVLLVDGGGPFAEELRGLLGQARPGASLHVAHDANTALGLAGELAPDVIVLDLELPGSDWRELLRSLREQAPSAWVYIVTELGGADEWAEARWMGAVAFAVKPVLPATFTTQLAHLLSQAPES